MGQAKQRGTFEERQSAAYSRINDGIEVRKKEIEQLEAFEKRQMDAMSNYVNNVVVKQMERARNPVTQALLRADYSQIELKYLSLDSEKQ